MKKYVPGKISRLAAFAAVMGTSFVPAAIHAAPLSDDDAQALIKRVNELEQQVKSLQADRAAQQHSREHDQETAYDRASDRAKAEPTVSVGMNGLIVRSADTNFVMDIRGYAQADYRAYFGQKTVPDTFLLRRVRPIIEGTIYNDYNYRLMLDLASGNVTSSTANNVNILDDAYVNAHFWKEAQFQVGKYKSPIGLERLQSTAELFFVETGFATQLTPNYDLGAMVHNDVFNEPIGYAVGIFDGAADGGSEDADTDEGKDLVGRVFFQPFLNKDIAPLKNLGFGVAGSYGTHTGGPIASYKTPGQQTVFSYDSSNITGTAGNQYRIDPQAYYFWGPFGLMGEYVLSSQEFKTAIASQPQRRFNNTAWQVEASYLLTGEENSYKAGSYKHTIPLHKFGLGEGSGWGAFELVGRVQQLTLDNNAFEKVGAGSHLNYATAGSAHQATSWGAGVNWYLNANLKVNLDYESTTYSGGTAAVGVATSAPEHTILSRVQFSF